MGGEEGSDDGDILGEVKMDLTTTGVGLDSCAGCSRPAGDSDLATQVRTVMIVVIVVIVAVVVTVVVVTYEGPCNRAHKQQQ